VVCPKCGKLNVDTNRFCGECGAKLRDDSQAATAAVVEGRKQVSVFFSDLSGYTAMSERLDAEEVKDIIQRIFSAAAATVKRYDGQIDKFIGDCVMVVFGSPTAHDDDTVRAVHAALDIHATVEELNTPELEARIGRRLAMHTGVNTGMVVVGELDIERGSEKILGDTVNVAARLAGVATAGEIVVGRDTYLAAARHFDFAALPPRLVKGKAEELGVYRLLGHRKETDDAARPRGLRAELVGRDRELALMLDAVRGLVTGRGAVVLLSGEAGSGKSRLVAEVKSRAGASSGTTWHHAFAEAHTGNTAYALWTDFLRRLLSIEDTDSRDNLRAKLSRLAELPGFPPDLLPYAGALYSLPSPQTQGVDPGHLKKRIQECIQAVVDAMATSGKTVFCLEDLHWADPSSLEILQGSLRAMTHPAVFVLVHRPDADLSAPRAPSDTGFRTLEVRLSELGQQDGERMIASLLGSAGVPGELLRQVAGSAAGNPFYIEEILNNLIETGALARSGDAWRLTRSLAGSDVPLTVQSVIEARIDRLEPRTRRVLQTASVIGRTFLYSLLKMAVELDAELDACLERLRSADVIRLLGGQPDLAYLFKHVLLQEVAYNSLLHKDQRAFHLRIARIMESVFGGRIEEFCEAIAYHYQRSGSREKAVEYLTRAGRKSMASYAAEEADAFFRKAYELVVGPEGRMERHEDLLIRLLTEWGFAHYTLGTFGEWVDSFERHLPEAESVGDQGLRALFYAELGFATGDGRSDSDTAHEWLAKAISIAEESGNPRALAYAHCWMATVSGARGDFREGAEHGRKGMELAAGFPDDPYLFGKSGYGKAYCLALAGQMAQARQTSELVRAYGERAHSPRCLMLAHTARGQGELVNGNPEEAVDWFRMAMDASPEPYYRSYSAVFLGAALVEANRLDEAEPILDSVEARMSSAGTRGTPSTARAYRALLLFRRGQLGRAFRQLQGIRSAWEQIGAYANCSLDYTVGTVYARMLRGDAEVSPGVILRNLPFLVSQLPFAYRRALQYFERSLALAREHGMDPFQGRSALQIGLLLRRRNRDRARAYLSEAVEAFGRTDLGEETAKAEEALRSL
jgi:class 3 adenylate cyclase/tetratricopeptide (TPR) repeat protein